VPGVDVRDDAFKPQNSFAPPHFANASSPRPTSLTRHPSKPRNSQPGAGAPSRSKVAKTKAYLTAETNRESRQTLLAHYLLHLTNPGAKHVYSPTILQRVKFLPCSASFVKESFTLPFRSCDRAMIVRKCIMAFLLLKLAES
jgi:hypothetical protein